MTTRIIGFQHLVLMAGEIARICGSYQCGLSMEAQPVLAKPNAGPRVW